MHLGPQKYNSDYRAYQTAEGTHTSAKDPLNKTEATQLSFCTLFVKVSAVKGGWKASGVWECPWGSADLQGA